MIFTTYFRRDRRLRSWKRKCLLIESLDSRSLMAGDLSSDFQRDNGLRAEGEGLRDRQLTWSIVPDGTLFYPCNTCEPKSSNLQEKLNIEYGARDFWFPLFERAVQSWDQVSGISFSFEAADDGEPVPHSPGEAGKRGEVRFAGTDLSEIAGLLGHAPGMNVVLNTSYLLGYAQTATILAHELGHVIGLEHSYPVSTVGIPKLMEERLPENYIGLGPQYDDVWQAQSIYGDNYEPNNSLEQSYDLGEMYSGTTTIEQLSTNWHTSNLGQADIDFYRFTARSQFVTIRAIPEGVAYDRGDSEATVASFSGDKQDRLRIELRDENGQLIQNNEAIQLGDLAQISAQQLELGKRYTVRVQGVNGRSTQMYRLDFQLGNGSLEDPGIPNGDMDWLTSAIQEANESVLPKVINVPPGKYLFESQFTIGGNITLVGEPGEITIFDGQRRTRHFNLDSVGELKIENITLMRGFEPQQGGSIRSFNANVTLKNVTLIENSSGTGGAVYSSAGSTLRLEKVNAIYNSATAGGGAISSINSDLEIVGSIVSDNRAAFGGGVYSLSNTKIHHTQILRNQNIGLSFGSEGTTLELTNSWVSDNTGSYGAGVSLGRGHSIIRTSRIEGNRATDTGGGIRIADRGTAEISESIIIGNTAYASAGITVSENSSLVLSDSWVRQNTAQYISGGVGGQGRIRIETSTISENRAISWFGGGIGVHDNAELTLVNSTVSLNRAASDGGGVHAPRVDIVHSTIAYNTVDSMSSNQGGGLHVTSNVQSNLGTVTNSIVAVNGSTQQTGGAVTDTYGKLLVTHSLLGASDEDTAGNNTLLGNLVGTPSNPIDPKLGNLDDNGGPTPTHRLLDNSPALNDGNTGIALAGLTTDQRGFNRQDGKPDMGAYESNREVGGSGSPTLDAIADPAIQNGQNNTVQVPLSGISDGNGGQRVSISALSSNLAVVRSVQVGEVNLQGEADLTLQLVEGTTGVSTLTVTVTNRGNDGVFNTADDLSVVRTFEVRVNGIASLPVLYVGDAHILEPERGQQDSIQFPVHLSRASTQPISVRLRTRSGTALTGEDFQGKEVVVTFAPGEVSKVFSVDVNGDSLLEATETFSVEVSDVTNAVLASISAEGTIYDNPFALGSPVLPTIRPRVVTIPTIYVVVDTTGPKVVPPNVPIPPQIFPEARRLMAFRHDIDRNGVTTPSDALAIIGFLNERSENPALNSLIKQLDVNRNGRVSPVDALLVINELNERSSAGEGETVRSDPKVGKVSNGPDWSVLSVMDIDELLSKNRRRI